MLAWFGNNEIAYVDSTSRHELNGTTPTPQLKMRQAERAQVDAKRAEGRAKRAKVKAAKAKVQAEKDEALGAKERILAQMAGKKQRGAQHPAYTDEASRTVSGPQGYGTQSQDAQTRGAQSQGRGLGQTTRQPPATEGPSGRGGASDDEESDESDREPVQYRF